MSQGRSFLSHLIRPLALAAIGGILPDENTSRPAVANAIGKLKERHSPPLEVFRQGVPGFTTTVTAVFACRRCDSCTPRTRPVV